MPPPVQYAKSGDLFIAYQVSGDLVAGSSLTFRDRGIHTLKGIPDPRKVLTVA